MRKIFIPTAVLLSLGIAGGWHFFRQQSTRPHAPRLCSVDHSQNEGNGAEEDGKEEEALAMFVKERAQYEYDLLRNPVSGKIPAGIFGEELSAARQIPLKTYGAEVLSTARGETISGVNGVSGADNIYIPAGPDNIGGRTRAVAFDKRNNQVILSGCISGGILRSSDGGTTWTRVSPDNYIHNLSTLAQDPRSGREDTWYAGGGEVYANSADANGALYLGEKILKSTDNGLTWTILTDTVPGVPIPSGGYTLENFDNPFDYVHKIIVDSANGYVYVAGHRRLMRSKNGGSSWEVVFQGASASYNFNGQMDITADRSGRLYLAVNGGFPDLDKRGLWTSTSGDSTNWTRIAGGSALGTDSVAGWRGNSYQVYGSSAPTQYYGRRILLALAPSSQNILYVTYENGLSQSGSSGKPEADLFKLDAGTNTWTNLSANVPDFTGQYDGIDPFAVQGGYDLTLAVKPDNPNVVFLGGVNLYRSTDGFSTNSNTSWINGYQNWGNSTPVVKTYANGHPDIHALAFDPADPSRVLCADDGGIQQTSDIMATSSSTLPVTWSMIQNYQSLQYYHVAIDPENGQNNFIGGAQDNGTYIRYADDGVPNNQNKVGSGDGGASAIAKLTSSTAVAYLSSQFGTIDRSTSQGASNITPAGLTVAPGQTNAYGEFVTYFKLDPDNAEDLYYVNFNRLFRTTAASTVTSSSWEELTGVATAIPSTYTVSGSSIRTGIRSLALSRGAYYPSHALYIGTNSGKIYRLDNPEKALTTAAPVDITPSSLTTGSNVSGIAVNPNDDNEIMAVVSNYGVVNIWWTNNAKSSAPTWYDAEGNLDLPSVRSCAIVVKKDASNNSETEYYVGTSVGLYSAVNIGTTLAGGGSAINWVREGGSVLNYAVVTSLDYRPSDNILLVGTHGNGMYYAQVGTTDYQPNQNTGLSDSSSVNDKNFIASAYPTVVHSSIRYQVGNMYSITRLVIRVYSISGQLVYEREDGYQNGTVNLPSLASGPYVLSISSADSKQKFFRKFVKQ